jgi:trans-L-3-hydroxyproline dehydratase
MNDESINVTGIGIVRFSIAYGGAFYAICNAKDFGFNLMPEEQARLIDYGRRIKNAIAKQIEVPHPFEKDLSFLYGTIFVGKPRDPQNHSRNVCIFADGELDRSATGSGVSARAALHFSKNELETGRRITIESIIGSTMDVEVVRKEVYGIHVAVVPRVSGSAYFTGRNELWLDPEDALGEGFMIR